MRTAFTFLEFREELYLFFFVLLLARAFFSVNSSPAGLKDLLSCGFELLLLRFSKHSGVRHFAVRIECREKTFRDGIIHQRLISSQSLGSYIRRNDRMVVRHFFIIEHFA